MKPSRTRSGRSTGTASRGRKDSAAESTQQRILAAATKLFATNGYDGTSTKEICESAGVNIAAIHYHFTSKEGLLLTILERLGTLSLQTVQRILQPAENAEEFRLRLRLFVEQSLESYLEQPDLWRIVHLEVELLHERSIGVFRNTFVKRSDGLVHFLQDAKKRGLIAKAVDPAFAARALLSQIAHQTRFDAAIQQFQGVSLHDERYRQNWIKQTIHIFMNGMING